MESLYERPHINPLAKYHLNGALKALSDSGSRLPFGELRFWDADERFHRLVVVGGEWMEAEVTA